MTRQVELAWEDIDTSLRGVFYVAMGNGLGGQVVPRVEKRGVEANDDVRCIVYRQKALEDA